MFLAWPSSIKAAIVSPHNTSTLNAHCFQSSLLPIMARKAYSMCESGPWLYPSPLCPALTAGGWQWWPLSSPWAKKYIAVKAYILHGPYAHSSTAGHGSASTASRPFWIHELFCCLWYDGENVSDFSRKKGREEGEAVIFFLKKWERKGKAGLSPLVRERKRERSVCLMSGSWRVRTAGLC